MAKKEQYKQVQELLITRRDALRQALAGDLSLLKELRQQSGGDVVDAALDSAQDEISSQLAEVESRELARIEKALLLIKQGVYGSCEGCASKIPAARLKALPYATYCIACQSEMERTGEYPSANDDWSRLDDEASDSEVSLNDLEIDVS